MHKSQTDWRIAIFITYLVNNYLPIMGYLSCSFDVNKLWFIQKSMDELFEMDKYQV